MAINSLSPGFVKLHYSVVVSSVNMDHTMVLPVKLTAPGGGSSSTLERRSTVTTLWTTIIDEIFAQLKTQLSNAASVASFTGAELYSQASESDPPVWEDAYFVSVAGTFAGQPTTALQSVFSFRSYNGGILKVTLIEACHAANLRQVYSAMTTAQKALADYFIGTTNAVIARDNGYPRTFLHLTTKVNDKVRKHRFNL